MKMENNIVYITKFNFSKILNKNELKENRNNLYKYKWEILTFIRNWDLIALNKHHIFMKNMTEWETGMFQKIITDTYTKIYEWGAPSYHIYKECKKLNSRFSDFSNNYEIPISVTQETEYKYINKKINQDEYLEEKKEKVIEFREWYKNNKDKENFSDLLYSRCDIKKMNLIIYWDHWNSGFKNFDNLDILEIEKEIDKKIREHNFFIDKLSDKERFFIKSLWKKVYFFKDIDIKWNEDEFWKIANINHKIWMNKENFKDFDYKTLLLLLREYDEKFLKEIIQMLKSCINIEYNNDFWFDKTLLGWLWFQLCRECMYKSMEI